MITLQDRARGSFIGLAVGDALGSPTEGKTPGEIFSKWGRVTDFLSDDQGGSDDTEYALFSCKITFRQEKENLHQQMLLLHGEKILLIPAMHIKVPDSVRCSQYKIY